ncbi:hypothetical protein, partial [Mesomycoplasma ovipneumoniae]|uniref:hypothetical protein n=1 Tax=Mesomycoplasma ovipneumoniae TaxID=29562 RepID=UPI003080FD8D
KRELVDFSFNKYQKKSKKNFVVLVFFWYNMNIKAGSQVLLAYIKKSPEFDSLMAKIHFLGNINMQKYPDLQVFLM